MYHIKTRFIAFLFFSFGALAYGQESISFRFKMPIISSKEEVNKGHYQQLERKIRSRYNNTNIFSTQTPFSIVPNIQILDVKNAGEVQTVKVARVGIRLSIQDMDNQTQFNEFETSILVTENDIPGAITKAINQMKTSSPQFKLFFTQAEESILTFYKDNCSKIVRSAKTSIEKNEYNRAYAFLKYVPETVSCYNEVERLIISIYNQSKEENCREMLQKAHIEKAQQNYLKSLHYINLIDPSTACYADAAKMVDEVGVLINKEALENLKREKNKFEKLKELEKIKILASQADFLQVNYDD